MVTGANYQFSETSSQ